MGQNQGVMEAGVTEVYWGVVIFCLLGPLLVLEILKLQKEAQDACRLSLANVQRATSWVLNKRGSS